MAGRQAPNESGQCAGCESRALLFRPGAPNGGVNYLPKYDLLILDEAHTVEDVAGQHFGLKISEAGLKYSLRALFDLKRGKGMLSAHEDAAGDAIRTVIELSELIERFFERCVRWYTEHGKGNGRIREANIVENILSPKLKDLALHLKAMLTEIKNEEEISELTSASTKMANFAEVVDAILKQSMPDAVYWMDVTGRTPKRVSLHAAPVNVAEGLKRYLFEKMHSVVMTSATLCTGNVGVSPTSSKKSRRRDADVTGGELSIRQGRKLPHWTRSGGIYAVTFRLADSLPQSILDSWLAEREELPARAAELEREMTEVELEELQKLNLKKIQDYLDTGYGQCELQNPAAAKSLQMHCRNLMTLDTDCWAGASCPIMCMQCFNRLVISRCREFCILGNHLARTPSTSS